MLIRVKEDFWNQKAPKLKNIEHYKRIELIRNHVKFYGTSMYCPKWDGSSLEKRKASCEICLKFFPRIKNELSPITETPCCPCYSSYTKIHLVRVLDMILRQNKHLLKEETPPCPE